MKCYLSGMPELRLGLNDKVMFESTGRGEFIVVNAANEKLREASRSRWKMSSFTNVCDYPALRTIELYLSFHLMGSLNSCHIACRHLLNLWYGWRRVSRAIGGREWSTWSKFEDNSNEGVPQITLKSTCQFRMTRIVQSSGLVFRERQKLMVDIRRCRCLCARKVGIRVEDQATGRWTGLSDAGTFRFAQCSQW